MSTDLDKISIAKKAAGYAAADLIKSGMAVGLGTGSTVFYFIERLGERCRTGLKIQGIPTSENSRNLAIKEGIPMLDENKVTSLDVTVDGADQVDRKKRMIKGGGGALLREKIVASMSREVIIIIDYTKEVESLGNVQLPVEITPFAYRATMQKLESLGYQVTLRLMRNNQPFITDNENYIIDLELGQLDRDPEEMDQELHLIPGVVDTGFFLGIANRIIVGDANGQIKIK